MRVGQLVERALLGGEHHGLDVAQGDALFFAHVEHELFQFVGDHHHVAAEGVHQFASGVGLDLHASAGGGFVDPLDGFALFDAGQFDDGAECSPRVSRMRW